jgi:hypothetical protein
LKLIKSTSFFEKKEAKKLFESRAWAVEGQTPMAQSNESFLVRGRRRLFFKKELRAALHRMAVEVTLDTFNVMPAQAPGGAPRHPRLFSASCRWTVKSWIPAFAGMTGLVGQSLCGLVLAS